MATEETTSTGTSVLYLGGTVLEKDSVQVLDEEGVEHVIRTFSLTCCNTKNGSVVKVELCSLGASITRFLVPSSNNQNSNDAAEKEDDIVLGLSSPYALWESKNPAYFGCVVGRVANRISKGKLQMTDSGPVYSLEINNPPNHLHGGSDGFSRRIWEAEIVPVTHDLIEGFHYQTTRALRPLQAVQFSIVSCDGDQGYPGAIRVTATYFLLPGGDLAQEEAVRLCVKFDAVLLSETTGSTPVNLAQHSYFNLSRHDDPQGVLEHKLTLCSDEYTPVDETGIPTRNVRAVSCDPTMDWRRGRMVRDALKDYGIFKAGLSEEEADAAVTRKTRISPDIALSRPAASPSSNSASEEKFIPSSPYGFDHNYVVPSSCSVSPGQPSSLPLVGVLEYEPKRRRLTVRTDAPGVQLYTANYLDGVSIASTCTKESAIYRQWQGLCLETQHFPDSILVDEFLHPEFASGCCVILKADEPRYQHHVVYEFSSFLECSSSSSSSGAKSGAVPCFCGSDTEGNHYSSTDEMWNAVQGVVAWAGSESDSRATWYDRTQEYYEENCPATINGVLGGFASITDIDLEGSRELIDEIRRVRPSLDFSTGAGCECGAGIGRVTKGLLLSLDFTHCDLIESSARLLSAAPEYIGENASRCRFFCSGLEDFEFNTNMYSMIWIQWVLCYLTDDDAIRFLRRCGEALLDTGGCICIKENTCISDDFVLDVEDASVTRSVPYLKWLADCAGLRLVAEKRQTNFPNNIFPVPMLVFEMSK